MVTVDAPHSLRIDVACALVTAYLVAIDASRYVVMLAIGRLTANAMQFGWRFRVENHAARSIVQ
jgi:hypothetical protein